MSSRSAARYSSGAGEDTMPAKEILDKYGAQALVDAVAESEATRRTLAPAAEAAAAEQLRPVLATVGTCRMPVTVYTVPEFTCLWWVYSSYGEELTMQVEYIYEWQANKSLAIVHFSAEQLAEQLGDVPFVPDPNRNEQ